MAKKWYYFIAPPDWQGGENVSTIQFANYYYDASYNPDFVSEYCNDGFYVCAILTEETPAGCTCGVGHAPHPYGPLSNNIKGYLIDGKLSGVSQPDIPSAKRYVYMREEPFPS